MAKGKVPKSPAAAAAADDDFDATLEEHKKAPTPSKKGAAAAAAAAARSHTSVLPAVKDNESVPAGMSHDADWLACNAVLGAEDRPNIAAIQAATPRRSNNPLRFIWDYYFSTSLHAIRVWVWTCGLGGISE